ncbi:hypothetical protein E2320_011674 [Naja naja]|nr:hypothetical protein E2320_011674 [Naja naja]
MQDGGLSLNGHNPRTPQAACKPWRGCTESCSEVAARCLFLRTASCCLTGLHYGDAAKGRNWEKPPCRAVVPKAHDRISLWKA